MQEMSESYTTQVAELNIVLRNMQAQVQAEKRRKGCSILLLSEFEELRELEVLQAMIDNMGEDVIVAGEDKERRRRAWIMPCVAEMKRMKVPWNKRNLKPIEESLLEEALMEMEKEVREWSFSDLNAVMFDGEDDAVEKIFAKYVAADMLDKVGPCNEEVMTDGEEEILMDEDVEVIVDEVAAKARLLEDVKLETAREEFRDEENELFEAIMKTTLGEEDIVAVEVVEMFDIAMRVTREEDMETILELVVAVMINHFDAQRCVNFFAKQAMEEGVVDEVYALRKYVTLVLKKLGGGWV
ncbi:hypothetical protein KI387_004798 [Taxus chinensis]|uniref:Uncharacterized protein n=1 Tax=Taxus chinensis TaxID=29808 RepID=A0AA38LJ27_TAXCH|nr:hypothetical protein KI387_004798 [Taxus chinensis]